MTRMVRSALGLLAAGLLFASSAHAVDRVYWAGYGNDKISFANLDGTGSGGDLNTGAATLSEPLGLAIDMAGGRLFWTNDAAPAIAFAYLDGSGGGDLNTTGVTTNPYAGIAVYPAGGKVFWGNYVPSRIAFANLDGSGGAGYLNTTGATVSSPSGIALDPAAGKLYWSNDGTFKISFANLDGSGGGGDLNTTGATLNRPFGVAIDPIAGKIFWANDGAPKISFANLDGSGGGDLNTTGTTVSNANGIAIDHATGRVYWASSGNNKVSFANLDNTGGGGDIDTTGATVGGPAFPVLLRSPSGAGAPAITGGSTPGSVLNCSPGSWSPDLLGEFLYRSPASFAYQWSVGGSDIAGATAASYTPGSDGSYGCRVTATNRAGSASQTSAAFAVTTPPPPPQPTAPPKASFVGSRSVITVDRHRRFSFSFHGGAGLTGTVVFKSASKVRVSRKSRRKRSVTFAQKSFTDPATGKVTVRVRLSKKNFRVLQLDRRIHTRVTVTLKNPAGLTSTAGTTVTLKAPRPARST
jgi:hypothetical protein